MINATDTHEECARLRHELDTLHLDAVLLSEPASICYVSGYAAPLPIGAGACFAAGPNLATLGASGGSALLVSAAEASQARRQSRLDEIIVYGSFGHFEPVDGRAEFLAALTRLVGLLLPHRGSARLGIEPRTLPALAVFALAERFPHVALVDAAPAIARARMVKTDREIGLLRRAAQAADAAQETLLLQAKPGVSEVALWGGLCSALEREAGGPVPISGELVSGPRNAVVDYPGGPHSRLLEAGDTIVCDISPCVNGYYADCCNTLAVGEPSADQRRYFTAARDAWAAAVEELRPGRRASDAAAAAARAFARHGLPVAHYTGHGIGASVNELPRLVPYDDTPIEAGMVFSVEPGAYAGPGGSTGSRTEKMVLVTPSGPEVLSAFRWGIE